MNRKFEFKVQQDVLDLGVKIKGVRIHDIDNTVYSSSLNDYIDVHVKRLLKNLLKKQEFHKINPLVDLYNLISMDTKLALGAHDLDKTEGNITLRLTQGNENYIPLGSEEAKEVKAGIYSYIDDANDIICFSEIRQVDKTKVTNESKDIFFIVHIYFTFFLIFIVYYLNIHLNFIFNTYLVYCFFVFESNNTTYIQSNIVPTTIKQSAKLKT